MDGKEGEKAGENCFLIYIYIYIERERERERERLLGGRDVVVVTVGFVV